jgi:hypothetical protein
MIMGENIPVFCAGFQGVDEVLEHKQWSVVSGQFLVFGY